MEKSLEQYDEVISRCKNIFLKKTKDYGTAWRILRPKSLTDQIYIKASRIRSLEEKQTQQVDDPMDDEFIGIVNYCVMAIIQLGHPTNDDFDMEPALAEKLYDENIALTRALFNRKNHDYDEVWRDMRVSSYTDLILMKILRIKQIEDNSGATIISEGIDANYMDILNYAVFALIKFSEKEEIA